MPISSPPWKVSSVVFHALTPVDVTDLGSPYFGALNRKPNSLIRPPNVDRRGFCHAAAASNKTAVVNDVRVEYLDVATDVRAV